MRHAIISDHSQIDEHAREICYDVKTHTLPQHGKIARLMVDEGHGFSRTANGRDLYVTRENVVHTGFDQLAPGMPM